MIPSPFADREALSGRPASRIETQSEIQIETQSMARPAPRPMRKQEDY